MRLWSRGLRAAGAIILGKTNLSQWANIRSNDSVSGWSSVGGLVKNPYALDRNACGSSSGSGAAGAASLAAATIGTETDGSIICPSSINGLVGFKPTVGLVSRTHVIPISHSQDTAGPMARSVTDAALVLTALAGSDAADPATAEADARRTDYAAGLSADYLKGVRIGVLADRTGGNAQVQAAFAGALEQLKQAGAELVEIKDSRTGLEGLGEAEFKVLMVELKADMNAYLATTPPAVTSRTLEDLIAFNNANAAIELAWFDQSAVRSGRKPEGAGRRGVQGGAGQVEAAGRTRGHRQAAEDAQRALPRRPQQHTRLGQRSGQRRSQHRPQPEPDARRRRLSAHHRADGLCRGAAGGSVDHRRQVAGP